jgi:hypothetical protein
MHIKFAVIRLDSYENGKIYISPAMVFTDEVLAHDRALFGTDAYKEPHVVLELRPVETVRGK